MSAFGLKKMVEREGPSTPRAIIDWDSGLKMMKWWIAGKTMEREDSNITRKALLNETFMGLKGLGYECKQLTDKLGLPNIMFSLVSNGGIKQAIYNKR